MAGRDIISLFSHRAGRQEGRDGGTDNLRDAGRDGSMDLLVSYGMVARDIIFLFSYKARA